MPFELIRYKRGKVVLPHTEFFRCSRLYGVNKQAIYNRLNFYFPELKVKEISLLRTGHKLLIRVKFIPVQKYPWDA